MQFELKRIGVIHTSYATRQEAPIQSKLSDAVGKVEVFDKYAVGLDDLEGFSHIILLYLLHLSTNHALKVKPFLDDEERGVFATRTPARPNNIGLSVVQLLERKDNILTIKGVDMIESTPLLDIKPYVPVFDCQRNAKIGWLEGKL